MRKLLLLLALLIGGCSVSINSNQRKSENHDLTMKIASRWIQKDSDINEYSDFNLVKATIHSPVLMAQLSLISILINSALQKTIIYIMILISITIVNEEALS